MTAVKLEHFMMEKITGFMQKLKLPKMNIQTRENLRLITVRRLLFLRTTSSMLNLMEKTKNIELMNTR